MDLARERGRDMRREEEESDLGGGDGGRWWGDLERVGRGFLQAWEEGADGHVDTSVAALGDVL